MSDNISIVPGAQPTQKEGNQIKTMTSDINTEGTLSLMLKELKKMNIHLSLMSDETIYDTEVE